MGQELKALGFRCGKHKAGMLLNGWRYGQTTKKVQGDSDSRQQPSVTCCFQCLESQIFRDHPELRMGWRHYLRLDLRGVVVLGGCD